MLNIEEELLAIEIQNYLNEKVQQITNEMLESFEEIDDVEVKIELTYGGAIEDDFSNDEKAR